jgi:hypothetical protein
MIAFGVICMGVGGTFAWLEHAGTQEQAEERRSGWVDGEARLYEVGIRWIAEDAGALYQMTARYVLTVAGRDYDGGEIARGYTSRSATRVKALIVPFAAEASEFSLQDLGPLNSQRSWSVAYRPVAVRYDAQDPARSQMVLDRPIVDLTVGNWLSRGAAALLILAGAALCALAIIAGRRQAADETP